MIDPQTDKTLQTVLKTNYNRHLRSKRSKGAGVSVIILA